MLKIAKVTAEYKVIIPQAIINKLDLKVGEYIALEEKNGEIIIGKVKTLNTDKDYIELISSTLTTEWLSEADEKAYGDL